MKLPPELTPEFLLAKQMPDDITLGEARALCRRIFREHDSVRIRFMLREKEARDTMPVGTWRALGGTIDISLGGGGVPVPEKVS